jgi:hypothetical protein
LGGNNSACREGTYRIPPGLDIRKPLQYLPFGGTWHLVSLFDSIFFLLLVNRKLVAVVGRSSLAVDTLAIETANIFYFVVKEITYK